MSDSRNDPHRLLSASESEEAEGSVALRLEGPLRKCCEALMELLPESEEQASLLMDVLPSLLPQIRATIPPTLPMRRELQTWEERSGQLIQLAQLHCESAAEELSRKLQRATELAHKAIHSLECLAETSSTSEDSTAAKGSNRCAAERHRPMEVHLREFCRVVLELLRASSEHGSVLSQTIPSMTAVFADLDFSSLDQMKAERRSRETTVVSLIAMAATLSDQAAKDLRQRVARSLASAARVIRALEAMQTTASPAASPVYRSDFADSALSDAEILAAPGTSVETGADGNISDSERERALESYRRAGLCQQQQDFASAERLYGEALQADPAFRLAYLHRGRVRLLRGHPQLAVDDLNEAIRLSAEDTLAFSSRGDALALCGQFSKAIVDYSRALELRPDSRVVRYNRAVAYRQQGMLDAAWEELELLSRLDSTNASVYLNRGLVCLALGERDRAVREFRNAIDCQPDCEEAMARLKELAPSETSDSISIGQASDADVARRQARPARRRPPGAALSDAEAQQILVEEDAPVLALNAPTSVSEKTEPSGRPTTTGVVSGVTKDCSAKNDPEAPSTEIDREQSQISPATDPVVASKSSGALTAVHQISLQCPACGFPSSVRWDRLQPGKVFACRSCNGGFTSRDDGSLMAVEKGIDGKWRAMSGRPHRLYQSRWVAAICLAMLIVCTFTLSGMFRSRSGLEPELPEELESRVQLFAEAWLKRDYRIIRRMTDPSQGPYLFAWHKKNPAPESRSKVKIAVEVVKDAPPITMVKVLIDGVKAADDKRELSLTWKEQNGEWLFLPTAETRVKSRFGARIDPQNLLTPRTLAEVLSPRYGAVDASVARAINRDGCDSKSVVPSIRSFRS